MDINAIIVGLLVLLIIVVSLAQYFGNRRLKTEKISRKMIGNKEWYK
jgi:hypothetical protein